jgi:hypothetical protein
LFYGKNPSRSATFGGAKFGLPYYLQDFQQAKHANHAVSFFINAIIRRDNNEEADSFDNLQTNEKLVIKKANYDAHYRHDEWKTLLIGRYPLKAAKKWIEANDNELIQFDDNKEKKIDRKIMLPCRTIWKSQYDS